MRFVAGRGADKVCCWQGRCGEAVAGRDPSAQRTAGRDAAVAEMLPARGAAVAEILLAGALWREAALWQRCCCQGDPSGRGEKSMREGKAASEKNTHLSFQKTKI